MISHAEILEHVATNYPLRELGHLGVGLGSRTWDRDREFSKLGSVIAGMNPESDLTAEDFTELEETEGQLSSPSVMPLTIKTVRRAVLYRNLPDEGVLSPKLQAAFDTEDGRGIWGEDGKIEAVGAGMLLAVFIKGLDVGGFPKVSSKQILRDQIEDVIKEECEGRSSYTAIGAMRHLYGVMNYAGLHTLETRLKQAPRYAYLLRNFGLVLADY